MKKKICCISFLGLVAMLFTLRLCAQSVEWSNQTKLKSKNSYTRVLGENGSGIFLLRSKNQEFDKEVIVEKYKSNLALDQSQELILPNGTRLLDILLFDYGLWMFTTYKNQNTGKVEVNYIKLDFSYKPQGQTVLAFDIPINQLRSYDDLFVRTSADKSKIVAGYYGYSEDKKRTRIHLYAFSDQMVPSFSKDFYIESTIDDVIFTDVVSNNEGDVFCLIDFPKTKKERLFYLFAYYQSIGKILEYNLTSDSFHINEIGLVANNFTKTVHVVGFYSHQNNNHADGEFIYTIKANTQELAQSHFQDLPKSFVTKVVGNMQNESGNSITDLYLRKIVPRSDGGCVVIAEKYYETKQTYTYYINGFPQTSYRTVYNYDEIICISKNADGSNQYVDFIKKNQSSSVDAGYYSSFVTAISNGKLGLIYNSDATNEGDVMITSITNKGVFDTRVLIKSLSYYVLIMPQESKQVSASANLICTLKDRRFALMRLNF
jgi:hypothetical protein